MKKILFLLLFISTAVLNNSTAQSKRNKLIGVWQVNKSTIADAWLSNYRFFSNGTFIYTFNQYDDRGRILNAKGIYKLKGDTLSLTIKTRKERVGGDLVSGSFGFQQEELVLENDSVVEVKQKLRTPIVLIIQWFNKKGVRGFKVQNNSYYFISADPHYQDE